MSKESFKIFARNNPSLANSVLNGTTTWQQLYELYEIYGENNSIWNKYIINDNTSPMLNILNTLKNIDMTSLQQGINNIEKTISLIQDIGKNDKR